MRHVMQCDRVSVQHAEAILISRVPKSSTGRIRKNTSFVDTTKAFVKYAGAFDV